LLKKFFYNIFTNTIDYEKERYKEKVIKDIRDNGFKAEYSSYNISVETAATLTDQQILGSYGVSGMINKYKTAKESRFDEINTILKDTLAENCKNFIEKKKC
jgi:hypothetical protein